MKPLHDTALLRVLSEKTAALLREVHAESDSRLSEFTRSLTEQEDYLRDSLVSAGEVITACDQLHYALAYLSGYRSRRTLDGELITRADYIAYQLENLYMRLTTVHDRCLKLVNVVFRLGLPPRECNVRTVADNQHVKSTPVRAQLRALDKTVQPYRQVRNTIAHHERFSDSVLAEIEGYFILEKSESPLQDPVVEQFRPFYKAKADRYIDRKRGELMPVTANVITNVIATFDALLPVFEVNERALA